VGLRKAVLAKKEFSSKGDRIEQAGMAFHRRVRRGYKILARRHRRIRVVQIHPDSTPDITFEKVRHILKKTIGEKYPRARL
jgi:thymidylate kinase